MKNKLEFILGVFLVGLILLVGGIYYFSPKKEKKLETFSDTFLTLEEKDKAFKRAIPISSPDGFVNTEGKPITLEELKGKKVVLLDIWTYSCINCQRTLPYINEWYEDYKDQGLEIIGLHTPEFAFEKVQKNVEDAVKKFDIQYPVVLDNDFSTWRAYGNQYWPRKYLIDIDGFVIYDHIGEGGYEETRKAIEYALKERNQKLGIQEDVVSAESRVSTQVNKKVGSPEIYFGSFRNEHLGNGAPFVLGEKEFVIPDKISPNAVYLEGTWDIASEYSQNKTKNSEVVFAYEARNVYMVAGSKLPVQVEVYKDDVLIQTIIISNEGLYGLLEDEVSGTHTLRLRILSPNLELFTFTFG